MRKIITMTEAQCLVFGENITNCVYKNCAIPIITNAHNGQTNMTRT